MSLRILVLPGDGIGPEVIESALALLAEVQRSERLAIELTHDLLHGAAYEAHGVFCSDETVERARSADAVLVGAVGGPRWDGLLPDALPEQRDGLMRLRRELDAFASLRPARAFDALLERTPYRREVVAGTDVMVVRELCGGVYFGQPRGISRAPEGARAVDTTVYAEHEIVRVARVAFELARTRRRRLLSLDKANVMVNGELWREVVAGVGASEYPDVELTHAYADAASYQLCMRPAAYDVIVADNLLGDLVSDQLGSVAGSLAMLPSASLRGMVRAGRPNPGGIYEPVHGSAPDIAGQGIANPLGAVLSLAMLFEHAAARVDVARRIEATVEAVLARGVRTPDLGGEATTAAVTEALIEEWRRL